MPRIVKIYQDGKFKFSKMKKGLWNFPILSFLFPEIEEKAEEVGDINRISPDEETDRGITLFEHDGFRGRELWTFLNDFVELDKHSNDETSSIKVKGDPKGKNYWMLYEHWNYGGGEYGPFGPGEYSTPSGIPSFKNDEISSGRCFYKDEV